MAGAPYLPRDLQASGVVLDDASGALEVVSPPAALSARSGVATPERQEPAIASAKEPDRPDATAAPAPPDAGDWLVREVEEMREFVRLLESTAGWRDELTRVREEVGRLRNPIQRLQTLEKFFRRATVNARDLAESFDRLKRETASGRAKGFDLDQLVSLFLKSGGRQRK
jgi:hypothetical protein